MIGVSPLPAGLSLRDPAVLVATGFGSGLLRPAPGTWGTLAAWLIGVWFAPAVLAAGAVVAFALGIWAVGKFEARSQRHDLGMIVIDEWAGVWLAMAFALGAAEGLVLAFALFRVFDILKPWPIGWMDRRIGGAAGVMLDDLAAGLAAGICVYGLGSWTHWF